MQIQQPLPVTKHLVEILYVNESKKRHASVSWRSRLRTLSPGLAMK